MLLSSQKNPNAKRSPHVFLYYDHTTIFESKSKATPQFYHHRPFLPMTFDHFHSSTLCCIFYLPIELIKHPLHTTMSLPLFLYLTSHATIKHIEMSCCKAFKLLGYILCTSCDFKHAASLKVLYFLLVLPVFKYGSVLWDFTTKIIERVQRQFLRAISFRA